MSKKNIDKKTSKQEDSLPTKKRFNHESLQDAASLQQLLQAVTQGVQDGQLSFSDEDGDIVMSPEGLMHLKLRATKKDGRNQFTLQVSWQDAVDTRQAASSLKVRSGTR